MCVVAAKPGGGDCTYGLIMGAAGVQAVPLCCVVLCGWCCAARMQLHAIMAVRCRGMPVGRCQAEGWRWQRQVA
jgi:hypothetical protein